MRIKIRLGSYKKENSKLADEAIVCHRFVPPTPSLPAKLSLLLINATRLQCSDEKYYILHATCEINDCSSKNPVINAYLVCCYAAKHALTFSAHYHSCDNIVAS